MATRLRGREAAPAVSPLRYMRSHSVVSTTSSASSRCSACSDTSAGARTTRSMTRSTESSPVPASPPNPKTMRIRCSESAGNRGADTVYRDNRHLPDKTRPRKQRARRQKSRSQDASAGLGAGLGAGPGAGPNQKMRQQQIHSLVRTWVAHPGGKPSATTVHASAQEYGPTALIVPREPRSDTAQAASCLATPLTATCPTLDGEHDSLSIPVTCPAVPASALASPSAPPEQQPLPPPPPPMSTGRSGLSASKAMASALIAAAALGSVVTHTPASCSARISALPSACLPNNSDGTCEIPAGRLPLDADAFASPCHTMFPSMDNYRIVRDVDDTGTKTGQCFFVKKDNHASTWLNSQPPLLSTDPAALFMSFSKPTKELLAGPETAPKNAPRSALVPTIKEDEMELTEGCEGPSCPKKTKQRYLTTLFGQDVLPWGF